MNAEEKLDYLVRHVPSMTRFLQACRIGILVLGMSVSFCSGYAASEANQAVKIVTSRDKERVTSIPLGDGGMVRFSNVVANNAAYLYDGLERELAVCLYGNKLGNQYFVREARLPPHTKSENSLASYNRDWCGNFDGYLGVMHNHPSGRGGFSSVDLDSFLDDKNAVLEAVVSKADRVKARCDISVMVKE